MKILRVACLRFRSSSNLIGDFLVVCLRNYGVGFMLLARLMTLDTLRRSRAKRAQKVKAFANKMSKWKFSLSVETNGVSFRTHI